MLVNIIPTLLLLSQTLPALSHPQPISALQLASQGEAIISAPIEARDESAYSDITDLWKRKGGGGGGGRGGGSSSSGSSSSGSSSSGSSSSGSSSSGSSSGSRGGLTSSSSNSGGRTSTGSGVKPAYAGGRYYGGGSAVPYKAGSRSPLGVAPVFLGVGVLAFYPGLWLYGAYSYPYASPYTYRNRTRRFNSTTTNPKRSEPVTIVVRQDDGVVETKPVTCLCDTYAVCGCDDNGDTTFLDSIIGDGTYANLNRTLVQVADINGTSTIVLNGTLPNGTTAAGGVDEDSVSAGNSALNLRALETLSLWSFAAMVGGMVWLL